MSDIEFLTDATPKLERHVIYFYQAASRALRKRVRDRVRGLLEAQGDVPISVQPKELLGEIGMPSLFPTVLVCDLEELPKKQVEDLVAIVLDGLSNCEQRLFLLAPCEPPKKVAALGCTVLVEPLVTTQTLQLVFDFCLRESKAFQHVRPTNQQAFREHFATELGQGSMSLWDFRAHFERLAIIAFEEATGRFIPSHTSGDVGREEGSLGLALEAFVQSDMDDRALRDMLLYVGRFLHQRQRAVRALVSRIQELTSRVLNLSRADLKLRRRALMWSVLLLGWDARLLEGPFENAFLELCQRFRESREEQRFLHALEGHWREVAQLAARYRLSDGDGRPQLKRLLGHMAAELEVLSADGAMSPRWLQRLGSLLYAPSMNAVEPAPTMFPPLPADWRQRDALRAFGDVLGQDHALRMLMKYLEQGAGQHIIFTGPSGAGKRALARLYAMCMWCLQRNAQGSPCGTCESCVGVLANATIDYFEVDFAQSSVGVASFVAATTVVPLLAEQRINALLNIDSIPRAQLDQLLKVLEHVQNAVFLFTFADVSLMNAAVLSRCRIIPVLSLTPDVAVGRLQSLCERENVAYELDALRVVAAVSRHRAGALLRNLASVAAGGPLTLERARDAFGLNWVPAVVSRLSSLMEGTDVSSSKALDDDEFVEHAQLVMTTADLRRRGLLSGASIGLHPALMCLASDWDAPLRESLDRRAATDGISADRIWDGFVDIWMKMDFCFWSDLQLSAQ